MSDVRAKLAEPGWTPAARDLPALFELLAASSDDDARAIERALVQRPDLAEARARDALPGAAPAGRVRLLRLIGRLVSAAAGRAAPELVGAVAPLLADPSPAVRRQAARALAAVHAAPAEADALAAPLADALAAEERPEVRRALVEALGKIGGATAAGALAAQPAAPHAADVAGLARARLAAARGDARDAASTIDLAAPPPAPVDVTLHARRGLAPLIAAALAREGLAPIALDDARVRVRTAAPLAPLAAGRMVLRLGVALPPPRGPAADDPLGAIAAALTMPATRGLLAALTRGPIRYRIAWQDGRHHRADTFALAARVAAAAPELINDPRDATWFVRVAGGPAPAVELEPRRWGDDRFGYRVAEVPAASHPTIAAALAHLAVAHARDPAADVAWDPFVGSGLELVERARAAPVRALHGTDLASAALAAAAANLAAAGVAAELVLADATRHSIAGLTAIITNPPMGRRVARGGARDLLARFVDHAGRLLAPGGVLTWISPFPRETRERASARGLTLRAAHPIDMGGFDGEIQVLVRSG